jgi:hypothetical protein
VFGAGLAGQCISAGLVDEIFVHLVPVLLGDGLGDRPAVVIVQFHQQPADHLAAGLPGLPPGKAPGHPPQQIPQQRGLSIIRYRGSSDCRVLVVFHKPIMIAAAAPLRSFRLTCVNTSTVTIYSCRNWAAPG